MKSLALALATVSLAAAASAQTFEVPGDFSDVQEALDAAPPGATIVVHGGHWFGIVISKPVTLVGDPRPYFWAPGEVAVTSPIVLAGPGSGNVVLQNLDVGVQVNANGAVLNAPGISGGGFDGLFVHDSTVRGPVWVFVYNYVFPGATGIDTDLPLVWVQNSVVEGSDTDAADTDQHSEATNPTPLGAPGGSGIVSTGTVVLVDSIVRGGDGDWISYISPDCRFACPGGDGGNGVVCQTLFYTNSTIEAGEPTVWLTETGGVSCCSGNPGTAMIVDHVVEVESDRPRPRFR